MKKTVRRFSTAKGMKQGNSATNYLKSPEREKGEKFMNKMKRILAVMLAMVMALAMSVTVFAAPTGSVTVEAPQGAVVTYRQIIVEDRTSDLGWKFADAAIENAFVSAYGAGMSAYDVIAELIETGRLENIANANVSTGKVSSSDALGRALAAVENMATDMAVDHVFTPSSIGLYVIKVVKEGYTFIPMSAYVGTDFNGLTAQAKGSEDQVSKIVEATGQSVSEGDVINYTVTAQYPYYSANAQNKVFMITDTVENATVNEDSVQVKIDGTLVTTGFIKTVNGNVLSVDFGGEYYASAYAGKPVEISYSVTVGEVSSTSPLKNTVKSEIETGATEYVVESDTVTFEVTKTDDDAENPTLLSGAEFTLYEEVTEGTEGAVELKYKAEGATEETTVYGIVVATQATDENGNTTFNGLDAQKTYYVTETKAPEGFSLNTTVYKLVGAELSGTESESVTDPETNITTVTTTHSYSNFTSQTVTDTKLSALPSTGGVGITIFTIVGCLIMIAAASMYFMGRRKNEE